MKFSIGFLLLFCIVFARALPFSIGVISDFERSPDLEAIVQEMIKEIDKTAGASREVSLGAITFGIADIDSAQRSYDQLDAQSDLVIALGSITAKGLSQVSNLSVPVVALGIIDPTLQEIPYINGTSGKTNFTYI